MSETPNGSGTLIGALLGFIGLVVASLLRWWPRSKKDREDRSVGLATIYSTGIQGMLDRYAAEMKELRLELKQAHEENEKLREDIEEAQRENEDLQDRLEELKELDRRRHEGKGPRH